MDEWSNLKEEMDDKLSHMKFTDQMKQQVIQDCLKDNSSMRIKGRR